ncbi:AMIN domain-containing protein [Helicobacter anatolicus]|uniref:AMIN domain-containing protein n=1 Tax=Helicobacter anatolicus TaxID=2905874 RepID=UPI001E6263EB|nr:AMIN domain-containing protein [Helicobacter anatolicus]MCE3040213.1 AMIN domain-containing protein [Helicobacter anatolicus]
MRHLFSVFLLFIFILNARENPFESTINPNMDSNRDTSEIKKNFESFDFKLPSTARILKEIKVVYQNLNGGLEEKTLQIDKSIDWHYPIAITQKDAKINESEDTQYFSAKKIIFFAKDNKLYITTKRTMKRNFILPEPFRIVIDFSKDTIDADELLELKQKYFSSIFLNAHKDFFRAYITLDGRYKYSITPNDDGYVLSVQ